MQQWRRSAINGSERDLACMTFQISMLGFPFSPIWVPTATEVRLLNENFANRPSVP